MSGPTRILVISFIAIISVGTLLLCLPAATENNIPLSFIEASFTATSATCVTGLIVIDTGARLSFFGELVVLIMIQIGGLGLMTFSTMFLFILRRKFTVRQGLIIKEALNRSSFGGMKQFLMWLFSITFLIELFGALILFLNWRDDFASIPQAVWQSVFHSVSAFCNAGFSLNSDSLIRYALHPWINVTIMLLIISGGIGFILLADLRDQIAVRINSLLKRDVIKIISALPKKNLSLHSKIVLKTTAILIVSGTILILAVRLRTYPIGEWGTLNWTRLLLTSCFQSVTARTAGFNTVDISTAGIPMLLILIVLMFIGGSSGSTAGGVKTTTIGVLFANIVSTVRGRPHVEIFNRTIPRAVVQKAITIFNIFIAVFLCTILALTLTEQGLTLKSLIFEAASALGTVGLSTGITPHLTTAGKIIIMLVMFLGRTGPITIVLAIAAPDRDLYEYPEETVSIG